MVVRVPTPRVRDDPVPSWGFLPYARGRSRPPDRDTRGPSTPRSSTKERKKNKFLFCFEMCEGCTLYRERDDGLLLKCQCATGNSFLFSFSDVGWVRFGSSQLETFSGPVSSSLSVRLLVVLHPSDPAPSPTPFSFVFQISSFVYSWIVVMTYLSCVGVTICLFTTAPPFHSSPK